MHDPLRRLPGYALRRVSAMVMEEVARVLAPFDLRPTEISVLMVIEANPGSIQSDIGRLLGIQRANMTPLVARLVERGLVSRAPVDGRSQGLDLTAQGASLTRDAADAMRAFEDRMFARLPPRERDAFMSALETLWDREE